MPMTQIFLHDGKDPAYLRAVSDSLHRALVDSFEVPPDDRFQVIRPCRPGELVYHPTYLGGPRSGDFVLFHITAGKPRSLATKRAFYRKLTEHLAQAPGIGPQDVMVVIATTGAEDWSFSHGIASMVPETAA